jgi:hypothetical protein
MIISIGSKVLERKDPAEYAIVEEKKLYTVLRVDEKDQARHL